MKHTSPRTRLWKWLARGASSLAPVMSMMSITCMGPQHFNDLAIREEKQSVDIISLLDITPGAQLADVGAGGGYYSFKMASATGPTGKVFAVDINPESLSFIQKQASAAGLQNIETVLAKADEPGLSSASVNLILLRNVYHHLPDRVGYFRRLRAALRPGGRIVIIDYDPARVGLLRQLFGHMTLENAILAEMSEAGYSRIQTCANLPSQSCNIFAPN